MTLMNTQYVLRLDVWIFYTRVGNTTNVDWDPQLTIANSIYSLAFS